MATPELSLGGHPLLFDHQLQIRGFLDKYRPLQETIVQIEEEIQRNSSRYGSRSFSTVGLPRPNYSPPPVLQINQLYWPTGASRWARGYFLCSSTVRDKLVKGDNLETSFTFKASATNGGSLETELFVLAPRPVSSMAISGTETLWILPLVDERYWWQFRNSGDIGPATVSTWTSLYNALDTALGITVTKDTVHASYAEADPSEFNRRYDSAAMILDAAAHSIGQRIVRQLDGTVRSILWSNTETEAKKNTNERTPWDLVAGADYKLDPVPEKVEVVFPVSDNELARDRDYTDEDLEKHTITKNASDYQSSYKTISGSLKTIHTTYWATFADGAAASPSNATALDNLADQIASDYYDSLFRAYDYTFKGIKEWFFNGYDDHALYFLGTETEHGHCYQTRIQSNALNFGVEQMLHQESGIATIRQKEVQITGKTDSSIADDDTGTVSIWKRQGTTPADSTEDVVARNITGETIEADAWVNVRASEQWDQLLVEPVGGGASINGSTVVLLELDSGAANPHKPGDSTTFNLYEWDTGTAAWVDSTTNVTGVDQNNNVFMLPGEFVWATATDGDLTASGRFDLIGPQGLHRRVEAPAEIAMGSSALCSVLEDDDTCTGTVGNHQITVCNGADSIESHRIVYSGEQFDVAYFHQDGQWRISSVLRTNLFAKLASGTLQSGSSATFNIWQFTVSGGWAATGDTVTAYNFSGITYDSADDERYEVRWFAFSDVAVAIPLEVQGGAEKILFKITSADTANCQATATVLGRVCGKATASGESQGSVTVYDPLCCILDEPDADLVDRMGWASRIELDSTWSECCTGEGGIPTETCIWAIDNLCCPTC